MRKLHISTLSATAGYILYQITSGSGNTLPDKHR
jgi:hypothetical protein